MCWYTRLRCADPAEPGVALTAFTTDSRGGVNGLEVTAPRRPGYYCAAAVRDGDPGSYTHHFSVAPHSPGRNVAVGNDHWLVITLEGTVQARGCNPFGQLGSDDRSNKGSGVGVGGLSGVISVAAGMEHSLAIGTDASLYAWGRNHCGQLGDPETEVDRVFPVQPIALESAMDIAAGGAHSLFVRGDGFVEACGYNSYGQIGQPASEEPIPTTTLVKGIDGIERVAAGAEFSLALDWEGSLWAWGDNRCGQLGDGTTKSRHVPARVPGLPAVKAVMAGYSHAAALDGDGNVWVWGSNQFAQCGGPLDVDAVPTPRAIEGLPKAIEIAVGSRHSAALVDDGTVWSWGNNEMRQLSHETPVRQASPVPAQRRPDEILSDVIRLAAGGDTSVAVTSDGRLVLWGFRPG